MTYTVEYTIIDLMVHTIIGYIVFMTTDTVTYNPIALMAIILIGLYAYSTIGLLNYFSLAPLPHEGNTSLSPAREK